MPPGHAYAAGRVSLYPVNHQDTRHPRTAAGAAPGRTATLLVTITFLALSTAGCKDDTLGPRRADHEAAHTPRYHPDVRTAPSGGGSPAASRPAEGSAEEAAEIFSGTGVGRPIMFVNNEPISVQDVIEPIYEDLAAKVTTMRPIDYQNEVIRLIRAELKNQVSTAVVYQEAKLRFGDEKFDEAFGKRADELIEADIRKRFGGVQARYEEHLQRVGMTRDEVRERMIQKGMVINYLQERTEPLLREPSRKELLQYYQSHKDEFTTTPRAEMFLIEIPLFEYLKKPLSRATPEELADARAQARARLVEAQAELRTGASFEDTARKYSKGINATKGGAWGEVNPGTLVQRWAKASDVLFTMSAGQVSDIVEATDALFLIKCGTTTPASTTSFEDAQKQIVDKLMDAQFAEVSNGYIRRLLEKASISDDREFLRAVVTAVPRPPPPSETSAQAR